ncbi:transposase [Pseudomonadota bacterium]
MNLLNRNKSHLTDRVDVLRDAVAKVKQQRPFEINAWVVLPDHLHAVWTLPEGDADYSSRWREIKKHFSKQLPVNEYRSLTRMKNAERGIWQRRFWEHTIRDDADYRHHVDYVHINPLKHGYVSAVKDWPYSSFHREVKLDTYAQDWAGGGVCDEVGGYGEL